MILDDGTTTSNDQEKVDGLNKFFSSVFIGEDIVDPLNFQERPNNTLLDNFEITEDDIYKHLKTLKTSKSPGPYGLHPRVLTEVSRELIRPLTLLYRQSLSEGVVPKTCKNANITPICKEENRTAHTNYRPVSVTSFACKRIEKITRRHILEQLKKFLSQSQHGFVEGRFIHDTVTGFR